MEVLILIAVLFLAWLCWQLLRAKQFTQFKRYLRNDIQPKVVEKIIEELESSRSELFPNNENHKDATLSYWSAYPVRILQYALEKELLTKEMLVKNNQWRYCQHLFAVEQQYINRHL